MTPPTAVRTADGQLASAPATAAPPQPSTTASRNPVLVIGDEATDDAATLAASPPSGQRTSTAPASTTPTRSTPSSR
ncbi:hypothetical protein GS940_24135 [Rhodococcus hoagii]|nr:hypothetical protein [Prescottella equi]